MKKKYSLAIYAFAIAAIGIPFCMSASSADNGKTTEQRTKWTAGGSNQPMTKEVKRQQKGRKTVAPLSVTPIIVVDENFSKFTKGSETSPERIEYQGYYIPDNLTAQPGWIGKGIAEAGGACAILNYYSDYYEEEMGGYLDTPAAYLYGEVTLTFKAKVINGKEGEIWVPLCDDYDGPLDSKTFQLTDQWQTFTFTTSDGTTYDNYFQFTPEDCEVLIDDVVVSLVANKVEPPYTYPVENISLTSFKAAWESQLTPEKYILDVYSKERPAEFEEGTLTESFNGINLLPGTSEIDKENPNYPAGWTIDVAANTAKGQGNSIALVLDQEGQAIVSPATPLPITSLKFWAKPSNMQTEEYYFSLIQVSVLSETGWVIIANIPNYWLESNGGFYLFDDEQIGEGATKIKISYLQSGSAEVAFAIDDITIGYASADVKVPFIDSKELDGDINTYIVEGIDPAKNYYYTVKAKIGDIVSKSSYPQWVDGISGIKPVALAATDVNLSGFTANWERLPHATKYTLKISELTTAHEYTPDVTVLAESFDKIETGTLENPGYDFISPFNFGENGMANADWQATQPRWIKGMAGSAGTSWYGSAGIVASPHLTLSNDGGEFDVEFSALSMQDNDEIFCMIIDNIDASQALDSRSLQLGHATELKSTKVHFGASETNRNNVMIAFMSKSGGMFFVDDIRISQNLRPGEALVSTYATEFLGDVSSYVLTGLSSDKDYSYNVVASTYKEFTDFVSNVSNEIRVDIASGVEYLTNDELEICISGNTITVSRVNPGVIVRLYDMQGREVNEAKAASSVVTLHGIPAGIYILTTEGRQTKLIVK